MKHCPFCDLLENGLPPHAIYEDENFFVMLDRQSVAFGHCMVILKKHVNLIYKMEDDDYTKLLLLAKKLANAIESNLNSKAVSYLTHGLGVMHTHLHLIPLKYGDEIVDPKKYMTQLTDEQLKNNAEKLLSKLPDLKQHLDDRLV